MAKKDREQSKKSSDTVTSDSRFAQVYNDPRFRAPKKDDLKIKLDDRFTKEELSLNHSVTKVDKYGRKMEKKNKELDDFDKYYEREDKLESESEDESEKEEETEATEISAFDRARGIGMNSDMDTTDESEGEEVEEVEEEEEDSDLEIEEQKPPEGEPTSVFAAVNMDWDHITSTDLYATFSSFVPKGGKIESVSIFPSEFGKQRMQQEDLEGPARDLFKSEKRRQDSDSEESDDEDLDLQTAAKKLYEEDDGVDYSSKALRKYQLQRLRYYYAVVKCDSVSSSEAIYESCDGTEYESTANIFDLRYVPEEMTFDDEPRDACDKVPTNYKPTDFSTDALQHSKVKLSWDETPAERQKMQTRAFSQKEIEEMDFKAYLASDSEDDDGEQLKNKYKNLVSSSTKIGDRDIFGEDEDEGDVDMEITFTPGLSDKKAEENHENDGKEKSTILSYRDKERERRKKRKERVKELKREQQEAKTQKRKEFKKTQIKKKRGEIIEEDEQSKKELEAVMKDEKEDEHFNMKEILKAEKQKKKGKKGKKSSAIELSEANAKTDLEVDDRFKEVFEDHRFAIDPTNSEFKNTTVMQNILKESKKQQKKDKKRKHDKVDDSKSNLGSLVNKIKKKSKK